MVIRKLKSNRKGVSPVIGLILMVAIVVVLAVVIGVYAVELSDSTSSTVTAGVETTETSQGVQVRWTSQGSAEEVYVLVNGSEVSGTQLTSVGDSVTISSNEGDTVSVIGVDSEGNESEIQSTTATTKTTDNSNTPQVVSGGNNEGQNNNEQTLSYSEAHTSAPACGDVSYEDADGDGLLDVSNDYELQCMSTNLSGSYELVNNIDASGTSQWNSGSGFKPVGDSESNFTGSLNGNGYVIDGLTIDRSSARQGLFGVTASATISNLEMTNTDIFSGVGYAGSLVSDATSGTVVKNISASGRVESINTTGGIVGRSLRSETRNVSSTVTVIGGQETGGVAGSIYEAEFENSSSSGTINGSNLVGGLIGSSARSNVTNTYSSAEVTATGDEVGGLIGNHFRKTVSNSFASGDVTSDGNKVGGLVGYHSRGEIEQSYATGNVSAENNVGGLVGGAFNATTRTSYAAGSVDGTKSVGGFTGKSDESTVSQSYATGSVSAGDPLQSGGAIGSNVDSNINNLYWDTESTGQSSSEGGTGLSTSEMQGSNAESNMNGFDFTSVWTTVDGEYPDLQIQE